MPKKRPRHHSQRRTTHTMTNKEEFIKLAKTHIKRPGIDHLLEMMAAHDFFTAPASTRFHGSYEGGLVEHSLNVYDELYRLVIFYKIEPYPLETIAIVSLFHDLCKMDYYKIDYRNRKNEQGKWERVPYYTCDDQFPLGHGEKSVMILQQYINLTMTEIMAINWHMGFSDIRTHEFSGINAIGGAMEKYPLVVLMHMADLAATYFDEGRPEQQ
nr:MAG TPA: Putative helicase [Caudoviricetes sp.]